VVTRIWWVPTGAYKCWGWEPNLYNVMKKIIKYLSVAVGGMCACRITLSDIQGMGR
jgi:hypothetical protein